MLVNRWLLKDVPTDGDPIENLAHLVPARIRKHGRQVRAATRPRRASIWSRPVEKYGAEGVIFAAPSFCDPALLDRPMLQHALKDAGIPYVAFKYAENSGQMQPIREQAGTFADSDQAVERSMSTATAKPRPARQAKPKPEAQKDASMLKQKAMMAAHYDRLTSVAGKAAKRCAPRSCRET